MSNFPPPFSAEQLQTLAANYGTPLYVYDAAIIRSQYQRLTTAFAGTDTRFFYACKALTNLHVLKLMDSLGAGIDCSSINEAKLALHAGINPTKILYTSNGIHFDEIVAAKNLGININIDSLSNLEKFGQAFGHSYPVGLRLRPNIMAGGNLKISTGHGKSKFGIPVEQIGQVQQLVKQYNLHIRNLHIHTGSELKDVAIFMQGVAVLFELIPLFDELEVIDLGGGFKVPYKKGDAATDIELLAKEVSQAFADYKAKTGRHFQVWFEPGKFLVSAAGFLLATVNVIKENPNDSFVGLNTGLNHLIRPMMYDAYHEIANLSNPSGALKTYMVVGNICETDTFATDRELNEVREGDLLAFFNAGAYGFEMSSNFNSRLKPAEVLLDNGEAKLIRKRDVFEDLLKSIV
jgi:diaminopimelate decarboxylase